MVGENKPLPQKCPGHQSVYRGIICSWCLLIYLIESVQVLIAVHLLSHFLHIFGECINIIISCTILTSCSAFFQLKVFNRCSYHLKTIPFLGEKEKATPETFLILSVCVQREVQSCIGKTWLMLLNERTAWKLLIPPSHNWCIILLRLTSSQ